MRRRRTDSAIEASYAEYAQTYPDSYLMNENNDLFRYAKLRLDFLKKCSPSTLRSLLEIGCAYGHFLAVASDVPFRAGIEPSARQATFARKHFELKEVMNASFEKVDPPPASWPQDGFDTVCSFHVLEHVLSPKSFLSYVGCRLKTGGLLCLAVPNLFSWAPDFIEYYFLLMNWHLNMFQPSSLSCLLENNGFRLITWKPEPGTPMLASSFIMAAKKDESVRDKCHPSESDVEAAIRAAESFHSRLETRIRRVRAAFLGWVESTRQVAIYGGGIHTAALMEAAQLDGNHVQVIMDDDSTKWGKSIRGVSIVGFREAMAKPVDVIVVSSLASEDAILRKMEGQVGAGTIWKGVYKDMANEPEKG